ALNTVGIPPVSQAVPVARQTAVLWGTMDFVAGRVDQQLQIYALQGFAGRLCDRIRQVLTEACTVLSPTTLRVSRPGLGLLSDAVNSDLEAIPWRALDWVG